MIIYCQRCGHTLVSKQVRGYNAYTGLHNTVMVCANLACCDVLGHQYAKKSWWNLLKLRGNCVRCDAGIDADSLY